MVDDSVSPLFKDSYARYHKGLFKAIKPILSFRTKDCINVVIYMSLKTETSLIQEIIEQFHDKVYHFIELYIYKAFILKKRKEALEDCMSIIKSFLIPIADAKNEKDNLFLTQIYLFYLGIEYDEDIYTNLKEMIGGGHKQVVEYAAGKIHRMFTSQDPDTVCRIFEIFDIIKGFSEDAKRILFINKEFFFKVKRLEGPLVMDFLEFFINELNMPSDDIESSPGAFVALLEIFFYIVHNCRSKEMKTLFLYVLRSDSILKSESIINVVLTNLFDAFVHLFYDDMVTDEPESGTTIKELTKRSSSHPVKGIDFNKLMTFEDSLNVIASKLEQLKINPKTVDEVPLNLDQMECLHSIDTTAYQDILFDFIIQFNDTNQWYLCFLLRNIKLIFLFSTQKRTEILDGILSLNLHFREENELIRFAVHNIDTHNKKDLGMSTRNRNVYPKKVIGDLAHRIVRHFAKSKYFYNRAVCKEVVEWIDE